MDAPVTIRPTHIFQSQIHPLQSFINRSDQTLQVEKDGLFGLHLLGADCVWWRTFYRKHGTCHWTTTYQQVTKALIGRHRTKGLFVERLPSIGVDLGGSP